MYVHTYIYTNTKMLDKSEEKRLVRKPFSTGMVTLIITVLGKYGTHLWTKSS
jgi:hypothetical protein